MERTLTLMIGVCYSGKTKYVVDNYLGKASIISRETALQALAREGMQSRNIDVFMMAMARSAMLLGGPIIIDESNITLESIFIWRSLAFEYDYVVKGILLVPNEKNCRENIFKLFSGDEETQRKTIEVLEEEMLMLDNLVKIFNMENQTPIIKENLKIIDGGNKNEIL